MSRSGAGVMGSAIPNPVPCNLDDRQFQRWGGWWGGWEKSAKFRAKKQGAAGITTAAPHIAGQWGRGDNRLPGLLTGPRSRSRGAQNFLHTVK
jgi:hypothetical protein